MRLNTIMAKHPATTDNVNQASQTM
jgi:hypothetical protein